MPSDAPSLDLLDRLAIAYLSLPLIIFLIGWLQLWAAVPLVGCALCSLKPALSGMRAGGARWPTSRFQLSAAIAVGCAWTACAGIGHWVFANADWHLRDAVLHDLVLGRWPVGYGMLEGRPSLLRAPIGYYLPAALLGKWAGLGAAHAAMAAWTAIGASLFLLLVFSQSPARAGATLVVAAVIVLFSGADVIGTMLRSPGFISHWDVTRHLEWWAGSYQYSSMTTQLFWVPNHALGGWLAVGLMGRPTQRSALEPVWPILLVALALWSPLTALGTAPFVLYRVGGAMLRERSLRIAAPRVWAPALIVGLVVAAYLTLDAGRIPRSWTVGRSGTGLAAVAIDLWHQAEFFLLEAGLIGFAVLAIRRGTDVVLALVLLALLPLVSFGAANDLVMRVSIPALTVIAVGAALALCRDAVDSGMRLKQSILAGLLAIGAVTPFQEFARAAVLERWPINLNATVVGAACGEYPPHYVARLDTQALAYLLRPPHALSAGPEACENPALMLQQKRALR
jgi:hypothetical protein